MEADKFVNSVEKYVREFVLYLLSFFWNGKSASESDPLIESVNKTFIFAILSAATGAYLWNRYIYGSEGSVHSLAGILTDTMLKWLSYALLLYGLMRICQMRPHILLPVSAVFKVLSVSYIVGIFGSYVAKNVLWMFSPNDHYLKFGSENAAIVAYLLQGLLICLYMPREINSISAGGARHGINIFIVTIFCITVLFVTYANYLDPLSRTESFKTIAGVEKSVKEPSK